MGRRTLLLIAALVVAGLGTALIFVYVQNADQRAEDGAAMVQVLVATSNVEAGTSVADASGAGAFELTEIRKADEVQGAMADVDDIANQVALAPIFEGQQILDQMFGPPGLTQTLPVPKGQIAISVQLGDPERVAGFVVPGSSVAIFATVPSTSDTGDTTQVLLPEVDVIGVGATTVTTQTTTTESGESTTEEIPRTVLTLAVDQRQAQQIINAQSLGQLYFGLRGEDAKVNASAGTNSQNLFR